MFGLSFPLWHRALTRVPAVRGSCQPQIEELETRLVMTAKITLANGVLRAVADNQPTTVTLRQVGGNTILNGFVAATKTIKRIEIVGGAKADTVVIQDTPAGKPVTVKTGGGNDSIQIGTRVKLLNGIKGQLKVEAGAGDDLMRLFAGETSTKLILNGGGGVNTLDGLPASASTIAHTGFDPLIPRRIIALPLPAAVGPNDTDAADNPLTQNRYD